MASPDGRIVFRDGRLPEPPQDRRDWVGLPLLYASPAAGVSYVIAAAIRQMSE